MGGPLDVNQNNKGEHLHFDETIETFLVGMNRGRGNYNCLNKK